MTELSDKQKRFCNEYLIDFNGTQAAIRAGYSKKTATEQASRLLTNVKVAEYLQSKTKKIASKLEITQERVMQEIGRIAFSDTRKLFNEDGSLKSVSELDDEAAAILAAVDLEETVLAGNEDKALTRRTRKVKLWDKTKGLEMLAKHFKIYSDAPVNNNNVTVGYGKEE